MSRYFRDGDRVVYLKTGWEDEQPTMHGMVGYSEGFGSIVMVMFDDGTSGRCSIDYLQHEREYVLEQATKALDLET